MGPGATIGVVGGGQLGRMLAEAGGPLGVEIVVLDPTPDAPAAPLAREQRVADFDDAAAIESLAADVDVVTYEIELADPDALERAGTRTGTPVHPEPETLRIIQDKFVQKRRLADAGIAVPRCRAVDDADELRTACRDLGTPAMLKARRGGYDGRGNVPIEDESMAEARLGEIGGGPAMVEEFVDFERELSVIGVRGADGERVTYTPGENIHEEEILRETVVPARTEPDVIARAETVADRVLDQFEGRGVFGIELFEATDGSILVNEVAPRPHNSGHWTIEGAVTSQFEQHARSVLGMPLGSPELRGPIVTTNILGDGDASRPAAPTGIEAVLAAGTAKLHWYGKREVRSLRKMGHIAVYAGAEGDRDPLLERAREIRDRIAFDPAAAD